MELLVLKLYQHASCSLISEKAYGGLEIRDWLKSKLAVTGSHQSKFSCNCKLHENTQVMQGIIASLILFNAILLIAHFEKNY